ncbi:Non-specific serine/threonine protein kinase [Bertholletia excelsa]
MALDFDNTCPIPLQNFSTDGTPFQYGPSYTDLFFFYNCSKYYDDATYQVDCASSNTSRYSFGVFHKEILDSRNYSTGLCESWVNAPAETAPIAQLLRMNFTDVLRRGFVLQWNDSSCSKCRTSRGRCGSVSMEFICFCPDGLHSISCYDDRRRLGRKLGIGFGAAGGTLLLVVAFLMFRRWRRRTHSDTSSSWASKATSYPSSNTDIEKAVTNYGVQIFRYKDLAKATSNFDSNKELGDGGFGTVHKGKLRDGREVAVKRLFEHNYRRVEQFLNEIEILARLHHQNLVTLYGCTSPSSRELLLVYEYIPNGTVADHLHGEQAKPGSLSWTTRMRIAVETASALAYLHASEVVHRDVKTNNILLDSYFHVKVADFGLSRLFPTHVTHVSTAPQGTPGYVDPEYHQCYHLTNKSDVYSFGVVLVELISSKPAVDITRHRHEINLSNMAINKIQNHELHELVDPYLGFESDFKTTMMISEVAELAFRCLQNDRDMRPSMAEVLETLNEIQSEDYCTEKAEVVDIPSEDVVQIKSDPPTVLLDSGKTTPQDSS